MTPNEKATAGTVALVDASTSAFYYPDHATVHGQTLAAFLRGESFTTLEARPRLHTTAIAQAVQKLRRAGWPVITERVLVPTADGNRRANVARYFLSEETIGSAGDTGRRFAAERRAA